MSDGPKRVLRGLKQRAVEALRLGVGVNDEDIHYFMEEIFNKPGAAEFLTPREVIRDFLNILSILRQNPNVDKRKLFGEIEISDERPDENPLGGIEEL